MVSLTKRYLYALIMAKFIFGCQQFQEQHLIFIKDYLIDQKLDKLLVVFEDLQGNYQSQHSHLSSNILSCIMNLSRSFM